MTIGAGLKIRGPRGTVWDHSNVGAVVSSGGLVVTAGGMSISNSPINIGGGVSVVADGMSVEGSHFVFCNQRRCDYK